MFGTTESENRIEERHTKAFRLALIRVYRKNEHKAKSNSIYIMFDFGFLFILAIYFCNVHGLYKSAAKSPYSYEKITNFDFEFI